MSIYFKTHEFDCHDGTPYPMAWVGDRLAALCSQLDPIREALALPLKVVSGYRTLSYNTSIVGAKLSQHVEGKAADIQPICPLEQRAAEVERSHQLVLTMIGNAGLPLVGGLGYYPGKWIHVDIRDKVNGHVTRWVGAGIGSEVS